MEVMQNADGTAIPTDVQSTSVSSVDGADYVQVESYGMPGFGLTLTQEDIDWLNNRPKADDGDFGSRTTTTASAGNDVWLGSDIGYDGNTHCEGYNAMGWWPPGPQCPAAQDDRAIYFPVEPEPASETCYTQDGALGLAVNGVAVYNWTDTMSYDNDGVWYQLAQTFEV